MQEIASQFKEYKFIESIELIPSLYLEEGGGFSNLDKLRQLFGIDVIMLLSYDQSQFKDKGAWSITYWTLIGYYVVKGEKNDTHTLMDAALFHIPSRKMLFRASGINHIKSSATPAGVQAPPSTSEDVRTRSKLRPPQSSRGPDREARTFLAKGSSD